MNITGVEVIRRNPGVAAVGVVAGEKLPIEVGDTVRVHMTVDYRGLEIDGAIWTAIGWQVGVLIKEFIEVFNSRTPVHFDRSEDFVTYPIDCDVEITDISAKLMEVPGPDIFTDICMGAIEVVEVPPPPEWELVQHTIYPWSYIYEGNAEICTLEFSLTPEQIPGTEWLGERIVDAFVSELEKEGGRLLELKVFRDTTPTWWTNYRVEVTATASPLAWNLIIIGVLAVLFIVAIVFVIKAVESLIYHRKGLDEETKKTFSRETLTAMILDLAPETPLETLEGMADQELRDLLNQLLAEVAPPISPWGVLAIVGGLGVLGVGAAVALTAARPKE
ncbi:hypothetical protein ES703_54553 [subsurface metagenome]